MDSWKQNDTNHTNIFEDLGAMEQMFWPFMLVLLTYLIISLFGNSIVCFVYQTRIKTDRESRFFIPILAIIDTLACIANGVLQVSDAIIVIVSQADIDIVCKLAWFFGLSTTAASMLVLLIIAIDRYLTVCRPQGRQLTAVWRKMSIAIIILIALIVAAPSFLLLKPTSEESGKPESQKCTRFPVDRDWLSYSCTIVLFSLVVLALTVLLTLYILICRGICRQRLNDPRFQNTESPTIFKQSDCGTLTTDSNRKKACYERRMETNAKSERNEIRMISFNTLDRQGNKQAAMKTYNNKAHDKKNLISAQKKCGDRAIKKRYSNVISSLKTVHESTRPPSSKITIMFTVVTIVLFVLILPKLVLVFLETVRPGLRQSLSNQTRTGLLFVSSLYITSFFVKPIIYAIMDMKFQNWLKSCCRRRKLLVTSQ